MKLAVRSAAALAYVLLSHGHGVGVMLASNVMHDTCPPAAGRQQYTRILRLLSRALSLEPSGLFRLSACSERVPRRVNAIVISDFLAEDAMIFGLKALLRQRRHVRALCLRSAADIPDVGVHPAILVDVETGERVLARGSDGEAARTRLLDRDRALHGFAERTGIALTTIDCETLWFEAVHMHLSRNHAGI